MLHTVREEIEATHRFFVRWFTGVAEPSELDAFASRLHEDLVFIGPSGVKLNRTGLLAMFKGRRGSNPGFRIDIRDVELVHDLGDHLVATYVEVQFGAKTTNPPDNARLSTVVFTRDMHWRHIHETAVSMSQHSEQPNASSR